MISSIRQDSVRGIKNISQYLYSHTQLHFFCFHDYFHTHFSLGRLVRGEVVTQTKLQKYHKILSNVKVTPCFVLE